MKDKIDQLCLSMAALETVKRLEALRNAVQTYHADLVAADSEMCDELCYQEMDAVSRIEAVMEAHGIQTIVKNANGGELEGK